MTDRVNGFKFLGQAVKHRLREPVDQTSFYVMLLVGILGMSALPVYIELYRHWWGKGETLASIQLALVTYAYALGGVSALQMIMERDDSPVSNFGVLVSALIGLLTLILIGDFFKISSAVTTGLAFLLAAAAVLVWWIANGDSDALKDRVRPDASTGGDPNKALPGGPGDFNV